MFPFFVFGEQIFILSGERLLGIFLGQDRRDGLDELLIHISECLEDFFLVGF